MFQVKSNVWPKGPEVYLTRGDTAAIDVGITDDSGEPYVLEDGDVVTFKVFRNAMDPTAVITKTLTYGDDMVVDLEPSDTASLPLGEYIFKCKIEYSNDEVDTFIGGDSRYPGKLTLL